MANSQCAAEILLLKLASQGCLQSFQTFTSETFTGNSWIDIHHRKSGDTVLLIAARSGHLDFLSFLLELDPSVLKQTNFDGKTALHEAALGGQLCCVEYLVKKQIPIDCLKRSDWTPLMLACTKKDIAVIKKLVQAGASLTLKNKDGWTPFHLASREGECSILKYILSIERNAWDTISKNSRTPLHTAAMHGNTAAVQLLLDEGSYEPDSKDSCGTTPLMDAIRGNFIDVAGIFINKHKANIFEEDNMGKQCIHLAAQSGSIKALNFLIKEHEADVNKRSSIGGVTPLHLSAKEGQEEMLEVLLSHGSDVNLTDHKGRTALHLASGSQHAKCAESLLCHGAKDIEDDSGCKPSHLARKSNVVQAFNFLHRDLQL